MPIYTVNICYNGRNYLLNDSCFTVKSGSVTIHANATIWIRGAPVMVSDLHNAHLVTRFKASNGDQKKNKHVGRSTPPWYRQQSKY